MIRFTIEMYQENNPDSDSYNPNGESPFIASSKDASGNDVTFVGSGNDPYEALHDLIAEFQEAELYRPD